MCDNNVGLTLARMICARHRKQSYPSIIAALRLGSFSFIQRDYDALAPFLRNHFLFPDLSDYTSSN